MKKRSSGWIGCLALIVFLAAIVFGGPLVPRLFDRLFAPWAFESAGHPALPGRWVGLLTTTTGRRRGVVLDLRLPEPSIRGRSGILRRDWRSTPHGELAGTARVCDDRGQVRSYTIEGEPDNRQATRLHFYVTPAETPAPEGLTLSWVKGAWDRADRLDLRTQFYWRKGSSAISGGEYPDTQAEGTLEMTRGGEAEFQAVCRRVKRRSPNR
jgi:hypothetical protein